VEALSCPSLIGYKKISDKKGGTPKYKGLIQKTFDEKRGTHKYKGLI
jgi:hypothetical protein